MNEANEPTPEGAPDAGSTRDAALDLGKFVALAAVGIGVFAGVKAIANALSSKQRANALSSKQRANALSSKQRYGGLSPAEWLRRRAAAEGAITEQQFKDWLGNLRAQLAREQAAASRAGAIASGSAGQGLYGPKPWAVFESRTELERGWKMDDAVRGRG